MSCSLKSCACLLLLALPALAAEEPVPVDRAVLVVRLPARATLQIGTSITDQTGPERTFQTPVLTPGKTYTYTLTATWQDGDKPHKEVREVEIRAGQRYVIELKAGPTATVEVPKARTFLFTYAAKVTGLKPGEKARIWLPVPPSNEDQEVKIEGTDLPGAEQYGTEKKYGNRILYVEGKADENGSIPVKMIYRVTRREVKADLGKAVADTPDVDLFLKPDKLVPINGKPLELIKDKELPKDDMAKARMLYDVVDGHMTYKKTGEGWGRGDAVWACDSKYGNCSDFHSLFISLARSQNLPAVFEMGFPLSEKASGAIPGYHCWAKFKPHGKGWIPVDISEANKEPKLKDYYFGNLSANRVAFSRGRDLVLVPPQEGEPLNFFIYPYVEVDGKVYDKMEKKFSFEDVK